MKKILLMFIATLGFMVASYAEESRNVEQLRFETVNMLDQVCSQQPKDAQQILNNVQTLLKTANQDQASSDYGYSMGKYRGDMWWELVESRDRLAETIRYEFAGFSKAKAEYGENYKRGVNETTFNEFKW